MPAISSPQTSRKPRARPSSSFWARTHPDSFWRSEIRKDYVPATLERLSKKGNKASTFKSAANEKNSTVHATCRKPLGLVRFSGQKGPSWTPGEAALPSDQTAARPSQKLSLFLLAFTVVRGQYFSKACIVRVRRR